MRSSQKYTSHPSHDVKNKVPERLKHQTQMLLVVEVPEQAEAVELVVRIGVVQLLEEF